LRKFIKNFKLTEINNYLGEILIFIMNIFQNFIKNIKENKKNNKLNNNNLQCFLSKIII